jgi:hypothetical protein
MSSTVNSREFRDSVAKTLMELSGCSVNLSLQNLSCATHKTSAPRGICLSMLSIANDSLASFRDSVRKAGLKDEFQYFDLSLDAKKR